MYDIKESSVLLTQQGWRENYREGNWPIKPFIQNQTRQYRKSTRPPSVWGTLMPWTVYNHRLPGILQMWRYLQPNKIFYWFHQFNFKYIFERNSNLSLKLNNLVQDFSAFSTAKRSIYFKSVNTFCHFAMSFLDVLYRHIVSLCLSLSVCPPVCPSVCLSLSLLPCWHDPGKVPEIGPHGGGQDVVTGRGGGYPPPGHPVPFKLQTSSFWGLPDALLEEGLDVGLPHDVLSH